MLGVGGLCGFGARIVLWCHDQPEQQRSLSLASPGGLETWLARVWWMETWILGVWLVRAYGLALCRGGTVSPQKMESLSSEGNKRGASSFSNPPGPPNLFRCRTSTLPERERKRDEQTDNETSQQNNR